MCFDSIVQPLFGRNNILFQGPPPAPRQSLAEKITSYVRCFFLSCTAVSGAAFLFTFHPVALASTVLFGILSWATYLVPDDTHHPNIRRTHTAAYQYFPPGPLAPPPPQPQILLVPTSPPPPPPLAQVVILQEPPRFSAAPLVVEQVRVGGAYRPRPPSPPPPPVIITQVPPHHVVRFQEPPPRVRGTPTFLSAPVRPFPRESHPTERARVGHDNQPRQEEAIRPLTAPPRKAAERVRVGGANRPPEEEEQQPDSGGSTDRVRVGGGIH